MSVRMPSLPMSAAAEAAYTKYVADHHGDLSDVENFAQTLFNAGGSAAIKASVEFVGIVPQLHRVEGMVKRLIEIFEAFEP